MLPHEKIDKQYYEMLEAHERVDKAYHKHGAIPPVLYAMALFNKMYFMYELNYMLWECNVGMIE